MTTNTNKKTKTKYKEIKRGRHQIEKCVCVKLSLYERFAIVNKTRVFSCAPRPNKISAR